MKIIHEIEAPATCGGGHGRPYVVPAYTPDGTLSSGFRFELLIVSPNFGEDEVIHIDGDAACIVDVLQSAADIIRACGEDMVDEGVLSPDWLKRPDKLRKKMEEKEDSDD